MTGYRSKDHNPFKIDPLSFKTSFMRGLERHSYLLIILGVFLFIQTVLVIGLLEKTTRDSRELEVLHEELGKRRLTGPECWSVLTQRSRDIAGLPAGCTCERP